MVPSYSTKTDIAFATLSLGGPKPSVSIGMAGPFAVLSNSSSDIFVGVLRIFGHCPDFISGDMMLRHFPAARVSLKYFASIAMSESAATDRLAELKAAAGHFV